MGLNELGAQAVNARPLEFFWVIDTSGSMAGSKIQQLNFAIKDSIPAIKKVADENPSAEIFMRVLSFGKTVRWHVATRTLIDNFAWVDLTYPKGLTPLGQAFEELTNCLVNDMPNRGLPPVIILVSDGAPTDDYRVGLNNLLNNPWGKRAAKIAIYIANDGETINVEEKRVLKEFMGNNELEPLVASDSSQLTAYIKWASTTAVTASSSTRSTKSGKNNSISPIISAQPPIVSDKKDDNNGSNGSTAW